MCKNFFIFLFCLMLCGCSPKLNITTLEPSNVNASFKNIRVERFLYDDVFQSDAVREKLANKTLNGRHIYNVNDYNFDVILRGKILDSSVDIQRYYKKDKNRCKLYIYDKQTKKSKCVSFFTYPCEKQTYTLKTKIELISKNYDLLFTKTYQKNKHKDKCYESSFHIDRRVSKINSNLALQIADKIAYDLSPRYKNFYVKIIEKINDRFSIEKDNFLHAVNLLKNNNIQEADFKLTNINKRLNDKSAEALYNLGLCKEVKGELKLANYYYKMAKTVSYNDDNTNLISQSILRTNFNIKQRQKALRQLKN